MESTNKKNQFFINKRWVALGSALAGAAIALVLLIRKQRKNHRRLIELCNQLNNFLLNKPGGGIRLSTALIQQLSELTEKGYKNQQELNNALNKLLVYIPMHPELKLRQLNDHQSINCTRILNFQTPKFICIDCSRSNSVKRELCVLCQECYEHGKHSAHRVIQPSSFLEQTLYSCTCGDQIFHEKSAHCSAHTGDEILGTQPEENRDLSQIYQREFLDLWRSVFIHLFQQIESCEKLNLENTIRTRVQEVLCALIKHIWAVSQKYPQLLTLFAKFFASPIASATLQHDCNNTQDIVFVNDFALSDSALCNCLFIENIVRFSRTYIKDLDLQVSQLILTLRCDPIFRNSFAAVLPKAINFIFVSGVNLILKNQIFRHTPIVSVLERFALPEASGLAIANSPHFGNFGTTLTRLFDSLDTSNCEQVFLGANTICNVFNLLLDQPRVAHVLLTQHDFVKTLFTMLLHLELRGTCKLTFATDHARQVAEEQPVLLLLASVTQQLFNILNKVLLLADESLNHEICDCFLDAWRTLVSKRALQTGAAQNLSSNEHSQGTIVQYNNCIALTQSFSIIVMHMLGAQQDLSRENLYNIVLCKYFPQLAPREQNSSATQIFKSVAADEFFAQLLASVQLYRFTVFDLRFLNETLQYVRDNEQRFADLNQLFAFQWNARCLLHCSAIAIYQIVLLGSSNSGRIINENFFHDIIKNLQQESLSNQLDASLMLFKLAILSGSSNSYADLSSFSGKQESERTTNLIKRTHQDLICSYFQFCKNNSMSMKEIKDGLQYAIPSKIDIEELVNQVAVFDARSRKFTISKQFENAGHPLAVVYNYILTQGIFNEAHDASADKLMDNMYDKRGREFHTWQLDIFAVLILDNNKFHIKISLDTDFLELLTKRILIDKKIFTILSKLQLFTILSDLLDLVERETTHFSANSERYSRMVAAIRENLVQSGVLRRVLEGQTNEHEFKNSIASLLARVVKLEGAHQDSDSKQKQQRDEEQEKKRIQAEEKKMRAREQQQKLMQNFQQKRTNFMHNKLAELTLERTQSIKDQNAQKNCFYCQESLRRHKKDQKELVATGFPIYFQKCNLMSYLDQAGDYYFTAASCGHLYHSECWVEYSGKHQAASAEKNSSPALRNTAEIPCTLCKALCNYFLPLAVKNQGDEADSQQQQQLPQVLELSPITSAEQIILAYKDQQQMQQYQQESGAKDLLKEAEQFFNTLGVVSEYDRYEDEKSIASKQNQSSALVKLVVAQTQHLEYCHLEEYVQKQRLVLRALLEEFSKKSLSARELKAINQDFERTKNQANSLALLLYFAKSTNTATLQRDLLTLAFWCRKILRAKGALPNQQQGPVEGLLNVDDGILFTHLEAALKQFVLYSLVCGYIEPIDLQLLDLSAFDGYLELFQNLLQFDLLREIMHQNEEQIAAQGEAPVIQGLALASPAHAPFIDLPANYVAFAKKFSELKCYECNHLGYAQGHLDTKSNLMLLGVVVCLVCGQAMCKTTCGSHGLVPADKNMKLGNCNKHAMLRHKGSAAFIDTKLTTIVLVHSPKNIIMRALYVNKFGEDFSIDRTDWENFFVDELQYMQLRQDLVLNTLAQQVYRKINNYEDPTRAHFKDCLL